jgi:hypothetical protein
VLTLTDNISVNSDSPRWPQITARSQRLTQSRTITVVEDLAWILPVKEENKREATKERALIREEEEVGLILQELGLGND